MRVNISIGGTGARVTEAFVFTAAMGLPESYGNNEYVFYNIDKDIACGNTRRMIDTVGNYVRMKKAIGDIPGCMNSKLRISDWSVESFMEELTPGKYVADNATYRNLAQPNTADGIIFDMFHSKTEQGNNLRDGFYGCPNLGAPLFKLMTGTEAFADDSNNELFGDIVRYMDAHPGESLEFVITGSIFGGTGASIFPSMGVRLRERFPQAKIHGLLMLPYFSYGDTGRRQDDERDTIAWQQFRNKTATALEYYGGMKDLVQHGNDETKPYIFNSIKLVGSQKLHKSCERNVPGGVDQLHRFLYHDLFAARGIKQAYERDSAGEERGANIYADASCNVIGPTELGTEEAKKLRIFTEFAFAVRAYLYPLLHSPGIESDDLLTKPFGKIKGGKCRVDIDELRRMADACVRFTDDYVKFILNIHSDLDHVDDGLDEVRLINYKGLKQMYESLTKLSDTMVGTNAATDLKRIEDMRISLWDGGHVHRPDIYVKAWHNLKGKKGANAEECFKAIVSTFYNETCKQY